MPHDPLQPQHMTPRDADSAPDRLLGPATIEEVQRLVDRTMPGYRVQPHIQLVTEANRDRQEAVHAERARLDLGEDPNYRKPGDYARQGLLLVRVCCAPDGEYRTVTVDLERGLLGAIAPPDK